jgi:SPP1 family predicted phage head-tail adaptor
VSALELGELRDRIDLQVPSGTSGDGYDTVQAGVKAQVRSAGGNELLRFGAQVAVNATVINMPYRTDVRASWRIYYPAENRYFQVTSYGDEIGDREWLTVYASEQLQ